MLGGIHLTAHKTNLIRNMCSEIPRLKLLTFFLGANEFMYWSTWQNSPIAAFRAIDSYPRANKQCPVKLFVGLHDVRGQPRFETRSLYHFMFKGEGGVVHGKMASAHFMCVTLLGNPYVNKQLICFRFKKNISYSTTEYNLLSHLLFYTNVFYIFGLSHCEKPVYY